jgi:hypothetical protein
VEDFGRRILVNIDTLERTHWTSRECNRVTTHLASQSRD